jgi:hypothetical protein
MKALYKHDCKFLGSYNQADLYFCPGGFSTILARFSNAPSDYISGTVIAKESSFPTVHSKELSCEWLIAKDCGFVS